ncbi:MAG: hypothetical protein AB8G26_18780 [Ilumatobacter sp.]
MPITRTTNSGTRRLLLAAAALCCVLALGGLVRLERREVPDRLVANGPQSTLPRASTTTAAVDGTRRFDTERTTPGLAFDLPADPSVELVAETSDSVEFEIASSRPDDARIVVVVPPVGEVSSASEALGWLDASPVGSFELIESGRPGVTRVRVDTAESMAIAGFRFGPRTFISASGENRRYEAWLTDRSDGGIAIVWVDAADRDLARAQSVVEVMLPGLSREP